MGMHDSPTGPMHKEEPVQGWTPSPTPDIAPSGNVTTAIQRPRPLSRRKLFGLTALGIAGAGVAGSIAATAGKATLENTVARVQQEAVKHSSITIDSPGGLNLEKLQEKPALSGDLLIGHLLRRAGFGTRPGELATYVSYGYSGAIDRLINYSQVPDDSTNSRLNMLKLDLAKKPQEQQRWWLLRMIWTQRPLLEKMTLFWHGLLTSSYRKVGGEKAYMRMMAQNQFLRTHAFDTFDNILLGITTDPAMLVYLDLTKSKKNAPNENYARELMELFTLGLGNYTQEDVEQVSLALTGWHVDGQSLTAKYNPKDHNTTVKTILGQTGNFDYKDVIRILTNHEAAPKYICNKLFTFFVYENPSDTDLQPMIDAYKRSNHNMGEVVRAMFLSSAFTSEKAYRSRVKSPVEFIVSACRALNAGGEGSGLPSVATKMGQSLFDPPNVAGWPGDKLSRLWLNSGTWIARLNFIDSLLSGSRNTRTGTYKPLDLQGMVNANKIDTPERFVDHFASYLLDGNLDAAR